MIFVLLKVSATLGLGGLALAGVFDVLDLDRAFGLALHAAMAGCVFGLGCVIWAMWMAT